MAEALRELEAFLAPEVRADVQDQALQHILAVSSHDDGRKLFLEAPGVVRRLLETVGRWTAPTLATDSALALINLAASPVLVDTLLQEGCVEALLDAGLNPESPVADAALMALCNVTREAAGAASAWERLEGRLPEAVGALRRLEHNTRGQRLHYLAPLLANATQVGTARRQLLEAALSTFSAFTRFEESGVRRGGCVAAIRNLCFEESAVEAASDLLPALLLPLAASDPFSDEEMDQLPLDLQFLPAEHKRESDPDLRRLLLEGLSLLAASATGRQVLKDNGVYLILRELHKWEKDAETLLTCQNLAELLIRTEDEIGADDLRKVEVPEHLVPKFDAMDKDFILQLKNDQEK